MADLTQLHGYKNGVRWRLAADGLEVESSGIERTAGAPQTVTRVWEAYAEDINRAATEYGVPCALIVGTICTESGGKADAVRLEPGYKSDEETPNRVSAGLMQTLISTAREALQLSLDRDWLLVPGNSIRAGTAYIAGQKSQTDLDPPLVAAAYNAGSLRHDDHEGNRWKLVQYPLHTGEHVDRFVKWFNDAVFVLKDHSTRPAVGYEVLLGAAAPAAKSFAESEEERARVVNRFPPLGDVEAPLMPVLAAAAGMSASSDEERARVAQRFPPLGDEVEQAFVPVGPSSG